MALSEDKIRKMNIKERLRSSIRELNLDVDDIRKLHDRVVEKINYALNDPALKRLIIKRKGDAYELNVKVLVRDIIVLPPMCEECIKMLKNTLDHLLGINVLYINGDLDKYICNSSRIRGITEYKLSLIIGFKI